MWGDWDYSASRSYESGEGQVCVGSASTTSVLYSVCRGKKPLGGPMLKRKGAAGDECRPMGTGTAQVRHRYDTVSQTQPKVQ